MGKEIICPICGIPLEFHSENHGSKRYVDKSCKMVVSVNETTNVVEAWYNSDPMRITCRYIEDKMLVKLYVLDMFWTYLPDNGKEPVIDDLIEICIRLFSTYHPKHVDEIIMPSERGWERIYTL